MRSVSIVAGVLGAALLLLFAAVVVTATVGAQREPVARDDGLQPAAVGRGTLPPLPPALAADTDTAMWAAARSGDTGIPARALQAYAAAELAQRERTPRCRLSWATLAGVGRVESDHGRYRSGTGSGELDADGVARPAIIGIPLDGDNGTREIRDTDGGELDGDPTYDRAVGPMQFLPTTWARYGEGDPQQVDAAARAAAAYLCAERRDLATGGDWWAGVLTYNASGEYARTVWAATERYADDPEPQ